MGPPTITTPPSLHLPKLSQKLKWITGMLIRPNVRRFIGRAEMRRIVFFLIGLDDTPALLLSTVAAFRLALLAPLLFSLAILESTTAYYF